MTKDRRLGRGLAALLGAPLEESGEQPGMEFDAVPAAKAPPADEDSGHSPAPRDALLHLNVYEIEDNPFQPRRDFGESEIASLAESLREHDMLQPILVRRLGDRYQLISGERRLRAAIQAGWTTVPARVREADDRMVAELAIVENLQRKDLNPIEKAMSFKRYLEEHRCSQEDLARRLKIDRSTIANLMRLLELPETVLAALRGGQLSAGHARALLPLGEEKLQNEFCQRIVDEGWSVRAVEAEVQQRIVEEDGPLLSIVGATAGSNSPSTKPATKRRGTDQVAFLEQELRIALGTKVEIRQASRGRGRIVVHFSNHDEFERLRQLLNGQHAGGSQAEVG
jgi:ParB family transcriptional regulator, chromosome partitioning protein